MAMKLQGSAGSSGRRRGRRTNRGSGSSHMISEINVTPFVDVMLVLLIVFMVAAPMMTVGVSVELPEHKANPLPVNQEDEPLVVSVQKDGQLYINKMAIAQDELAPKLIAITNARQGKATAIVVRGDRDVDYGAVHKVLAAINLSGFRRVGLESSPLAQ